MKQYKVLSATIALLISLPASAHFIWLEQVGGQTKLYFGEYESGVREKTGGRLDTIAAPVAKTIDNKLLAVATKRAADYIVIEGAGNQTVLAQELTMKVKDLSKYLYGIVSPCITRA
ncbi:MAG: hypothetical protein ACSHWN_07700 [Methylophilaceae bacterium]